MPYLPQEIIEYIFEIAAVDDPLVAFKNINNLNRSYRHSYTRNKILKTYHQFSLDEAARKGHVSLLNWWIHESNVSRDRLPYTSKAIASAAENGNVKVLNWFDRKQSLPFKIDHTAIPLATKNGHLHVLKWFLKKHFDFGKLWRGTSPFTIAVRNGHMDIVTWWLKTGQLSVITPDLTLWIGRNHTLLGAIVSVK